MNSPRSVRPESSEYAAYYAAYVGLVPEGDIVTTLERQLASFGGFVAAIPPEREQFRYAEGKWSPREVLGHITDTERIMGYRLLRFARGDQTPLPGYEENDYVRGANFDEHALADLLEEFADVRRATLALLRRLPEAAWTRTGTANGVAFSVRGLAHILAGHVEHHARLLRERYL